MPDADIIREEQKFLELATAIASLPMDQLLHPPKAGTYNFEDSRVLFEAVCDFYKGVSLARMNIVPQGVLTGMWQRTEQVVKALRDIQAFDYRMGDPNRTTKEVVANLSNQWAETYQYCAPHVSLARVASGAIDQALTNLKAETGKLVVSTQNEINQGLAQIAASGEMIKKQLADAAQVMVTAREAAKLGAVSAQAKEFDEEATAAKRASWGWFAATVFMVVVSVVLISKMFLKDPASLPVVQTLAVSTNRPVATTNTVASLSEASIEPKAITVALLQQTIARILIVTIFYSAVVWCARNYFASRHNYTVNRHRRNAMQTFRAFVEGTKDPVTQDFILRQAAACAFSPQQSGYLKDESLPTPGPASQIVDMVKPAGKAE